MIFASSNSYIWQYFHFHFLSIVSPVINKSRKVIVVSQIDQLKALCNIIQSNPVPMITWEYQPWPCHDAGYKCPPLDSKWLKAGPQFIQPNDGNPTMSSTFVLPKSKVQRFHIRCFANHSYGQDVHNIEAFIDKRGKGFALISGVCFSFQERIRKFKFELHDVLIGRLK